jgi:hypothetical protein
MADCNTTEIRNVLVDERYNDIIKGYTDNSVIISEESKVEPNAKSAEADICKITPVQAYMSTNLNSKIKCYEDVATRILNMLGYPSVGINDLHRDQIFESISIAVETYMQYCGYTDELLVFDSLLYEENKGIRIDQLYTIASLEATHDKGGIQKAINRGPDHNLYTNKDVYVTRIPIPAIDYYISEKEFEVLANNCSEADKDLLCHLKDLSLRYPNGIEELSIITGQLYEYLILRRGYCKEQFKKSKDKVVTEGGEKLNIYWEDSDLGRQRDNLQYAKMYDYDVMDYRKVISVYDFQEGSSSAMSSLFAFETAMAATTYYNYQFSMRGFDLTSWTAMNMWRKDRDKLLATKHSWHFDPHSQYFTLSPQPRKDRERFFGVLHCYVEQPLREVIKSPWVWRYALALCKIILGGIRSKWGQVSLLGGGTLDGSALLQQGQEEKKELEQQLIEKRGFGEAEPPLFFIG